jgi:hypothetical protein
MRVDHRRLAKAKLESRSGCSTIMVPCFSDSRFKFVVLRNGDGAACDLHARFDLSTVGVFFLGYLVRRGP